MTLSKAERDALVVDHLARAEWFAVKTAFATGLRHLQDDLIAEAHIGLVEASQRFEPERGHEFFTFALHWVRGKVLSHAALMRRSVRRTRTSAVRNAATRLPAAQAALLQELEREPTPDELAVHLGVSLSVVERALHSFAPRDTAYSSVDVVEDGRVAASPSLTPEDALAERQRDAQLRHAIDAALACFAPRTADVLRRTLIAEDAESLAAVARDHGITRERARQIQVAAMPRFTALLKRSAA